MALWRAAARPARSRTTLAAATGATLADLMARLGHSTPSAALRYQHAVADRDRAVAEALSGFRPTTWCRCGERTSGEGHGFRVERQNRAGLGHAHCRGPASSAAPAHTEG